MSLVTRTPLALKIGHRDLPNRVGHGHVCQTYHVERRYIELIKYEAETEGVSITEVLNRALRTYFERK
jgi:hypothetical protein